MNEFLDEKKKLISQIDVEEGVKKFSTDDIKKKMYLLSLNFVDKRLATKKVVAMETYFPANGKPDTQTACAKLVNKWYPGLNATGDSMVITNGCTQSLMCVMHVCFSFFLIKLE